MSDNSNITRDDLIAISYVFYSSLCIAFDKPHDTPQEFETNCRDAFKKFSEE